MSTAAGLLFILVALAVPIVGLIGVALALWRFWKRRWLSGSLLLIGSLALICAFIYGVMWAYVGAFHNATRLH